MSIGTQETECCPRCGVECRYLFSFDLGPWLCVACCDDDVQARKRAKRFGRRVLRG